MAKAPGQTTPFDAYAGPLVWGSWVRLAGLVGGPFEITISADTASDAPSSFDGEVEDFAQGGIKQIDAWAGPGSISFLTEADSVQQPKMRFKSHSLGQIIKGTYFVRAPSPQ